MIIIEVISIAPYLADKGNENVNDMHVMNMNIYCKHMWVCQS